MFSGCKNTPSRGGATRSDVIISDGPIPFPKVHHTNVLVAPTNEACNKYLPFIRPNGLCLYDSDLVQLPVEKLGVPCQRAVFPVFPSPFLGSMR